MIGRKRRILLMLLSAMLLTSAMMSGCASTFKSAESFHGYSHSVEVSPGWRKLSSYADPGHVLFRLRFMKGTLFTFSMWTVEYLEFIVKVDDLKPGKRLMLSNLDAWSIAKAYIIGVGQLKKGEVIIESVSPDRIEARVFSPELPSQFHGVFVFKVRKTPDPVAINGRIQIREELEEEKKE